MKATPLSLGQIRDRLAADGVDVPIHRVKYAIGAAGIQPCCRIGILRCWPESALPKIRAAILKTARRNGGSVSKKNT